MKANAKRTSLWEVLMWGLTLALVAAFALPLLLHAAEAVSDAEVLDSAARLIGMFGLGVPGYALALAGLSFAMKLTKWGRTRSLFHSIPKPYRSAVPIVLGGAIGTVEGLAAGLPWWQAIFKGVVLLGGAQQMLYEQVKGTPFGAVLARATDFVPTVKEGAV